MRELTPWTPWIIALAAVLQTYNTYAAIRYPRRAAPSWLMALGWIVILTGAYTQLRTR